MTATTKTEYDRTLEVIASGFEDETHEHDIVQHLDALLKK